MRLALCTVLLAVPAGLVHAQTNGDVRAFTALRASHIGALTPILTPAMMGRTLTGAQLGLRYGLRDESSVKTQTVAASGLFAIGMQSSLTLTAGVSDADCFDCTPALLLGLGGDMRIYQGGDVAGG